jgi:hypothetical protein
MLQHVAADHDLAAPLRGARIWLNAAHAVADVCSVRCLAHLAVADHVDTGCDLPGDDIVDRVRGLGFEHSRVDRAVLFKFENKVNERLWARQAARVSGEDPVG